MSAVLHIQSGVLAKIAFIAGRLRAELSFFPYIFRPDRGGRSGWYGERNGSGTEKKVELDFVQQTQPPPS